MKKRVAFLLAAALFASPAIAQTNPGLSRGVVLTPGQWDALFSGKQDTLGFTPLNSAGGVMLGRLVTAPPGATTSGLNLTPGTAPGSPANGDLWVTGSGLFAQINGATVGPIGGASSGSFAATLPLAVTFPGGVTTYAINNGTSVLNPGTGTLESVLPVQTVAGASKSFLTADLFKKTRRSNSGSAMSDTFPASTATGMVNGTRIVYANTDATATATITAGAGTVMASGGATDTVGPGRDVAYEYDLANTQWRRAYNTGTALLGPNNLSDLASASSARSNLGVPTGTSGAVLGFLNTANTWSATQTFPNNSLTLAEFPTIGADTVLGSIAGGTPATLSQTQLTSLINPCTTTLNGAVPAPGTASGKVLSDSCTWIATGGTGTVTSVGITPGAGMSVSGSPITTSGNITIGNNLGLVSIMDAAYGAKCNAILVSSSASYSITSGSNVLTGSGANVSFSSGDVGKSIWVPGAGASGAGLSTTIASYTNSTTVVLAANASTTISSLAVSQANPLAYGTDDTAAINAAINATPQFGTLIINPITLSYPVLGCLIKQTGSSGIALTVNHPINIKGGGNLS
jgi:hypothetical protein